MAPSQTQEPCSLTQLLVHFLRLGAFGFGGPIAPAGRMDKDLVEETSLGLAAGLRRGPRVFSAFAGPARRSTCDVHRLGEGAAVIAIIGQSAYRLSRKTIGADPFLWLPFAAVAITTVWTGSEIVWLFVLCGVVSMVVKRPPSFLTKRSMHAMAPLGGWWLTGLQGTVSAGVLGTLTLFFLKAGAFVFRSGLAIWLTERQLLDAIAVAMITPGPVVITAAFIGYEGLCERRHRRGRRSDCRSRRDSRAPGFGRLVDGAHRLYGPVRVAETQENTRALPDSRSSSGRTY